MVSAYVALASNTYIRKRFTVWMKLDNMLLKRKKMITTIRMCENKCSKSYLRQNIFLNNTHAASYIFHKPNK